jgi:hypothetical protein
LPCVSGCAGFGWNGVLQDERAGLGNTRLTDQPRQLAVIRDYGQLIEAMRDRASELNVSRASINDCAGFQDGYAEKLLCGGLPGGVPLKRIGHQTLGPLLTVLGTALVLVEDLDAVAKITSRMAKRQNAGNDMQAVRKRRKRRRYPKLGPEWGRIMRARQLLMQSEELRGRIARQAARARWGNGS